MNNMEITIAENQVIIMMVLYTQVNDESIKKALMERIRFTEARIKNLA